MFRNLLLLIAVWFLVLITGCAPQESQTSQKQPLVEAGEAKPQAPTSQNTQNSSRPAREMDARLGTLSPPPPPTSYQPQKDALIAPAPATVRGGMPSPEQSRLDITDVERENYQHLDENTVKDVQKQPVSTFSIDVDTGSYSNVRRMLQNGLFPRKDAVRVEELINYFSYNYPTPEVLDPPFKVSTELTATPWNKDTYLLKIGIKGYDVPKTELPPSNLVFLLDVSGSMEDANKLGLLKSAFKLLVNQLTAKDKISIAVYAGSSGVVLEPTSGAEKAKIITAIEQLRAGGSTNGGEGIHLAYSLAAQGFIRNGINRILLATDGDFNVGTVNFDALKNLVEEKRKTGVSLTTLGFGTGNYNEHLMEQLADAGNGNYAYIDTLNEAQKVLVEEMSSTLQTIAKDVKIQLEFNPDNVAEYRLIGYENRALKQEDFNNDKVDAGEIGAGHTVTALYEIALQGGKGRRLDNLRYSGTKQTEEPRYSNELAFLRLRYKAPTGDTSKLLEYPVERDKIIDSIDKTSEDFRFATAVAAFGQLLRGGTYLSHFSYDDVTNLANKARGEDKFGYRNEFVKLVQLAKSLSVKAVE